VRQFFALAGQHMRWELNDMARRLAQQPAARELREGLMPAPAGSGSGLTREGRAMTDDRRLGQLIDELLNSRATPEEVCASCPELLPQVRARWQKMCRLRADLDALFPTPPAPGASPPATPPEGTALPQVPGHEVRGVLGRGGMGVVYRAWDLRLNRPVALKMLLAGAYADPADRARFQREAEAVAGLCHPNIVQVHDVGEVGGRPYFTMEFVEGGDLAGRIQGAPQPARQAAALVATLAEAVHAAHQSGIVHRDLKPSNVLLTKDGTPKVTDFGLARRLEGDGGLTVSGTPMGTPSYMAPEQARGDKRALGPATDVYALGAILYELLTGRPPFHAESGAATLQQVLADEPVPPARLNPRVPRDLTTICLKCLEKDPARRYRSAAALADDLRRFGRGEPILARPLGRLGRLVRWARRRPAEAALLAAGMLAALAAVGGGGWVIGQRTQTARAVRADLREAVRSQQQSALPEARVFLEQAQLRLGDDGPARLRSLLDQARHDQQLLERLEAIRMTRSTFAEGRDNHPADVRFNNAQADRGYKKAFRDAALGEPPGDPDGAAGRVRASAVRVPLVAALDDWAACSPDGARRDWVLRVARGADPDGWRDRARDPAAWGDGAALAELARSAPVAGQPPSLLLALGERLQLAGGDGAGLLRRVQEQYPNDFWTNFTLARVLHGASRQGKGEWLAATPFYQKALDLRPKAVAVHNNLGLVLMAVGWLDDNADGRRGPGAITVIRRALRIDPEFAPARNNLGLCLKRAGIWWVAVHEYQDALRADPDLAPAHFSFGEMVAGSGQIDKGIDHYRQALRVDPDFALAHYYLGIALLGKGRRDEVDEDYPEGVKSLSEFRGSALPQAIVYYWQAYECAPEWVAARNGLRIPAPDGARLDEAIDHYRQAIRLEPGWFRPHGALGQALLARRQFAEADAAFGRCLELLPPKETKLRGNLERLRERCRHLRALQRRLAAVVQGKDKPAAADCRDLAELCFVKCHYATAARLYAEALAATPRLTEDLRAGHRLNAARAAALAVGGRGDDMAGLGEPGRERLRKQAREWLRLDLAAWTRKVDTGTAADRIQARRALSPWPDDPDLAGLRDADALERLPSAERQEWRVLWQEVAALLRRAESTR
jgi:eukaryotic-like serine/threonine-protein kinase